MRNRMKVYAVVYENKVFDCISCGAVFSTRDAAEKHIEKELGGGGSYDRAMIVEHWLDEENLEKAA